MMRGKAKSLDDFFARESGSVGAKQELCDISLCTATTTRTKQKPAPLCTWKRNPNAFRMDPLKMRHNTLNSFSKSSTFRQDMLLMSVKEEDTKKVLETTTSSFGGVTLGMAQILYAPDTDETRGKEIGERTDIDISETRTETDDESSGGFEVTLESKWSSISSLGRKGTLMVKEAKFVEEKVRSEECKIAEERRLLDMEHTEFQTLLREFQRAEQRRRVEEAKLAERRNILREAYLTEQERLMKEEERLMQESKKAALETRRILDEARFADRDNSFDAQFSRSLTCVQTLGVLSETTWEHDYCETSFENEDDEIHASLAKHHWKEIEASLFNVRGKNYLSDGEKVPSNPNLFRLITVDLVEVSKPILTGFCSHPKERVQKWLQQEKSNSGDSIMPAFVFCVNLILPGPPYYHLVMYFAIDDLEALGLGNGRTRHPYSSSLRKFLFGKSDVYRNKALKMIPRVKEGSFLLKTAVGTKPLILGKYLDQQFIQGDRYLELIADVGSNSTFQKLLRMSSNYNSKLVGSMGFLLEGSNSASLPENIMCSVELTNQDFNGEIRFVENTM